MSKLDHDIARQSATLIRRRQCIRRQKQALRYDALALCKQPSTLFTASLVGAALARIRPPGPAEKQPSTAGENATSTAGSVMSTVRIVVLSLVTTLIKRAFIPL